MNGKFKDKIRRRGVLYIILVALVIILSSVLTRMFYYQAIQYNDLYKSDLPAHITFATSGRGYSLLYAAIGLIYKLTENVFFIALFESFLVIGTWLLTGKLLQLLVCSIEYACACFAALPLTFLTGIYIPFVYEHFYRQQLVTQPYHNITYYGMRFFAVCVMICLTVMIDRYLENIKWQNFCFLTLFLMLSTAIKPSFLLGFAAALLFFLIIDFLKYGFERKKFSHIIIMGMSVIPSLIVLIVQAKMLYGKPIEEGGSGIALIWGANFVKMGLIPTILKLICGLSFPCLVLLVNNKKLRKEEKFVYLMFAIQLLVCIIFSETGRRARHGNFYWGLYCAAFFLFVFAGAKYWRDCRELDSSYKWYKIIGFILFFAHLMSGAVYFVIACSGNDVLI